jgi:hypothetical protein
MLMENSIKTDNVGVTYEKRRPHPAIGDDGTNLRVRARVRVRIATTIRVFRKMRRILSSGTKVLI